MQDEELIREMTWIFLGGKNGLAMHLLAGGVLSAILYLVPYFTMKRVFRRRERLRRALRWPAFALCLAAGAGLMAFYIGGLNSASGHILKAAREDRVVISPGTGGPFNPVEISETVGGERRPLVWVFTASDLARMQSIFAKAKQAAPAASAGR